MSFRYDRLSLEACLNNTHFQRCRGLGCNSSQVCYSEDSYIICSECGERTCIRCDALWHADETCDNYAARQEEEARNLENMASTSYLERETKRCPGCGVPTEKYAGCDYITCMMVGSRFEILAYADVVFDRSPV